MQSTRTQLRRQASGKANQARGAALRFQDQLRARVIAGQVAWWGYRSLSLDLGTDGRYTPDFSVIELESDSAGQLVCLDVRRQPSPAHKGLLQRASTAYPFLKFGRVLEIGGESGIDYVAPTISLSAARARSPLAHQVEQARTTSARKKAIGQALKESGPNGTEKRYQDVLAKQLMAERIAWWGYESITLRLGQDCRYTPDYLVLSLHPERHLQLEVHEVKAMWHRKGKPSKVGTTEDSTVKLRVAAHLYPWIRFVRAAEWQRGQFQLEVFAPGPAFEHAIP